MKLKRPVRSSQPALNFGQSWQDTDVLLQALDVRPEHVCLSVASGGDNTLALLSRGPQRVIVIDSNPSQIALLELKVAAFRELSHTEMLILFGSKAGGIRESLYRRCRPDLSAEAQAFWDAHPSDIAAGLGNAGAVEKRLNRFRSAMWRFARNEKAVERLFRTTDLEAREKIFLKQWCNWRWKMLFSSFFTKALLKDMGHDTAFLQKQVQKIDEPIRDRVQHLITKGEPSENPYLQWWLIGRHTTALPFALRPENFEAIRANLDRLEWSVISLEGFARTLEENSIDRFNLADAMEPLTPEDYYRVLDQLSRGGRSAARLAYWNMFIERSRPNELGRRIRPMEALSGRLEELDKSFLYPSLTLEGLA
jgi:S-adenosylmethionine-diacylglycerol 3-amino-3-carboxypropyl transferase